MSYKKLLSSAALPLLLGAAACASDAPADLGNGDKADSASALDPAQARERIQLAADAMNDSLDAIERSSDELSYAAKSSPLGELLGGGDESAAPSEQEALDELLIALVGEDNYEGNGVYTLGADLLCEDDDFVCIDQAFTADMRVYIGLSNDELILKPMIGPERLAPLVFAASDDGNLITSSIEFDLGAAAGAIRHLASVYEIPVSLPQTLSGTGYIDMDHDRGQGLSELTMGLTSAELEVSGSDFEFVLGQAPGFTNVQFPDENLRILVPDDPSQESEVHMHLGELSLLLPFSALGNDEVSGGLSIQWEGMAMDLAGSDEGPIQFRTAPGASVVTVVADDVESTARVSHIFESYSGTIDGIGVTHPNFEDAIGDLTTFENGFDMATEHDGKSTSHSIHADTQIYSLDLSGPDGEQLNALLAQETGDPSAQAASLECVVRGTYAVTANGQEQRADAGQCIIEMKGDAFGTVYAAFAP